MFDYSRGFRFISYAVWHIEAQIISFFWKHRQAIRIPENKRNQISKFMQALNKEEQKMGGSVSKEILFEKEEFKSKNFQEALKLDYKGVARLDKPVFINHGSSRTPLDYLSAEDLDFDPKYANTQGESYVNYLEEVDMIPDNPLASQDLRVEILRSLSTLTYRQMEVIIDYFGLETGIPLDLTDLAIKYGLTRERARQVKEKAISKLRANTRCKHLKPFLGGNPFNKVGEKSKRKAIFNQFRSFIKRQEEIIKREEERIKKMKYKYTYQELQELRDRRESIIFSYNHLE